MKDILIVADEFEQMKVLADALKQNGDSVLVIPQEELSSMDAAVYDAIFMYVHKILITDAENALIQYARSDGRMIVLHHGIASGKRQNPTWLEILGIHIDPPDHPTYPWLVYGSITHTVVNLSPGHYVTSHEVQYDKSYGEFPAFDLEDTEIFVNQQFTDGDEKTVLLGVPVVDPVTKHEVMQPSGWYKQCEKGLLFYFQAGHCPADFRNRNFAQILINALQWNPE